MGIIRSIFRGENDAVTTLALAPAQSFAIDAEAIPAEVFGLESYTDAGGVAPRIDRRRAMQVPAVKRARDLVAGTLGTLPVELFGPDRRRTEWSLFEQPEPDVPRSITMAKTFEDMLFEGVAWWRITKRAWNGWPTEVRRLDPRSVQVRKDQKVYVKRNGEQQGTAMEWVPDEQLIRFHGPTDGLLIAGARAIRTCLLLDAAAANMADGVPPVEFFTPAVDGVDLDAAEAIQLLDDWKAARRERSAAWVPSAVKYNSGGIDPEKLQLADARQHAVLEIARLTGIDPEDLGVSTTSRTYQNGFERRKAVIDFTLAPYMVAAQDVLSMRNVTPRGYLAQFNPDALLRADPKSRWESYAAGLAVGAITPERIAAIEGVPDEDVHALPPPAAEPTDPQEDPVSADQPAAVSFDEAPAHRLDAVGAEVFEVNVEQRTIRGLAVPYGKAALSGGVAWQFAKGTLKYADVSRVKLWVQHDSTRAVGVATKLEDTDAGLVATFKVARGAEGDQALSLAEDKVLDGLSIGLGNGGKFQAKDGVQHAVSAPLMEISLTPAPAFDDARVHAVAASAANTKENTMKCTKCGVVHPAGVTECKPEDVTAFEAAQEPDAPTFETQVTDAIAKGFEALTGGDGPQLVPAGTVPLEINESAPYRFDGLRGEHDFSTDLISFGRDHDGEAGERVMTFMREAFAPRFDVDRADVTTLNPARNRPDMYVDERRFRTPLYDALYKGAITDMTPFLFPKFASAAGLVADHVEGVEPTPGSFTATNQTVTPSAVSGKVEITREVWDQGGNPQVSGLIWNKIVQHYYTALEAKALAILNTLGAGTDITLTTNAVDAALVNELEAVIADLNFIAGGNTFDYAGTHQNLYRRLAAAVDTTGRKLLPIYGPTNANGQARKAFQSLDVAGVEFEPVPTLGAASNANGNSFLVDSSCVHVWNSAPQRLEFQYRVAYVDLAVWGYCATAISDAAGVRRVKYDPTT